MKVVLFCHSVLSDWNHGNAHFLRGLVSELARRGHSPVVYEPRDGWSVRSLVHDHGEQPLRDVLRVYPLLEIVRYDEASLDLQRALDGAELVLVHEWNPPSLVAALGRHRRSHGGYRLLFHDTHHRSVTDAAAMRAYDLDGYDGVLAFGATVRERYLAEGWARRVWTFHEAADVTVFRPPAEPRRGRDLVWIGNWGDDERTAELAEFLVDPVRRLGLAATVHGVRYPPEALEALSRAGIRHGGWLPNHEVPRVFGEHRVTVHVPRRPYARALRGIPTIRVFEALACGIPLVSAPWEDAEGLFRPSDYVKVETGREMEHALRRVLEDAAYAEELGRSGLETIRARHTCAHRADELLRIHAELAAPGGEHPGRGGRERAERAPGAPLEAAAGRAAE